MSQRTLRPSNAGTIVASGVGGRQIVQGLRVRGGAFVGERIEIDDGNQRVVDGRRDRPRGRSGRQMARACGQTDERDRQQQSIHAGVLWAAGFADGG